MFVLAHARAASNDAFLSSSLCVGSQCEKRCCSFMLHTYTKREALYELCARGTTCFEACNGTTCVPMYLGRYLLSLECGTCPAVWLTDGWTALDLWRSQWPFIACAASSTRLIVCVQNVLISLSEWVQRENASTRVIDRQTWQSDKPFYVAQYVQSEVKRWRKCSIFIWCTRLSQYGAFAPFFTLLICKLTNNHSYF